MPYTATTITEHYIQEGEKRGKRIGEKIGEKRGKLTGRLETLQDLHKQKVLSKNKYDQMAGPIRAKLKTFS